MEISIELIELLQHCNDPTIHLNHIIRTTWNAAPLNSTAAVALNKNLQADEWYITDNNNNPVKPH